MLGIVSYNDFLNEPKMVRLSLHLIRDKIEASVVPYPEACN